MNTNAALLLVLCTFFKLTPISAQPDIQVRGFKYSNQLKEYAQKCLSSLGVDRNIQVHIIPSKFLGRSYEGQTIKLSADTIGREQFVIYLREGLTGRKQFLVLAHEIIHVKQYESQRLDIRGDQIFWLGRKYYLRENSLFDPPWENEAYSMDYSLTRTFSLRPGKAKKANSKFIAKNIKASNQTLVYP